MLNALFSNPQTLAVGHKPPIEKPTKILVKMNIVELMLLGLGYPLALILEANSHDQNIVVVRMIRHMITTGLDNTIKFSVGHRLRLLLLR